MSILPVHLEGNGKKNTVYQLWFQKLISITAQNVYILYLYARMVSVVFPTFEKKKKLKGDFIS